MKEKYTKEVVPKLMEEFKYRNASEVPTVKCITLNMTTKDAITNQKILETTQADISSIAGQRAVLTKSKKSIAGFKLRENLPIGVRVTLRKDRMWEFLDRFVSIALPRVRDFRGINSKSFDGRGNYNLGIQEQIVFPEINYDKIDKIRGLNISIQTSATNDKEGLSLLSALGMPFFKKV